MLKHILLLPAVALGIAIGHPAVAVVNLVQNPGFETGDFTDWTLSGDPTNYVQGSFFAPPIDGNYTAYFASPVDFNVIDQVIPTTPGDTYDISFMLENLGGPANEYIVQFGGNTLTDVQNSPPFPAKGVNLTTVATSSSSTLQFQFTQNPSAFGLDDISVVDDSLGAVPEPSTPNVLVVGGFLIGSLMLSRRKINKPRPNALQ